MNAVGAQTSSWSEQRSQEQTHGKKNLTNCYVQRVDWQTIATKVLLVVASELAIEEAVHAPRKRQPSLLTTRRQIRDDAAAFDHTERRIRGVRATTAMMSHKTECLQDQVLRLRALMRLKGVLQTRSNDA